MSDAVTTARTARESLAQGLNALQSDPNVPPQLIELASPIAQSMGALRQIEQSNGTQIAPHAEIALNHVRTALAGLQAQPSSHPAVIAAMEAVAGSLGLVHSLTRMAPQAAVSPPAAAAASPYAATQAVPSQPMQMPPARPATNATPYAQFPDPQQPSTAFQRPSQEAFQQPPYAPPQQVFQPPPAQQQPIFQQPAQPVAMQQPPAYAAPPAQRATAPQAARDPFAPAQPQAATALVGDPGPPVAADLGAHSPSNFYKGLAGNDIIDHGGLFVSTYKIPKIGTPVRIKVSLPGGYEFEANAIVRWSREASDGGNDAPPGFGAQFTEITPEARQLVYRYVRNREPLFHDDL